MGVQAGEEIGHRPRTCHPRVLPIEDERTINRLIPEEHIMPAKQRKRSLPTPLQTSGAVSELIAEQRL